MAFHFPPGVLDFVKTSHHDTYPFVDPLKSDLSGRNVLVTGASRGLGRAIALSYARAGASGIAIAARTIPSTFASELTAAATAAGRTAPTVVALNMDVLARESVDACAAEALAAFGGKLDVVVANHGMLEEWRSVAESDPDEWWRSYEVNVRGLYLVARAFLPALQTAGSLGVFVGMSSIGQHVTTFGGSAYQSGKLAVHRLCEFMSAEGQQQQKEGKVAQAVCAVALHPGAVVTELALNLPEHMHAILVDTPEMTADVVVWLTRERREWLSGRYVSCNWDVEELEQRKDEIVERDLLKMRMTY